MARRYSLSPPISAASTAAQPVAAQPVTAQPVAAQPVAAQPVVRRDGADPNPSRNLARNQTRAQHEHGTAEAERAGPALVARTDQGTEQGAIDGASPAAPADAPAAPQPARAEPVAPGRALTPTSAAPACARRPAWVYDPILGIEVPNTPGPDVPGPPPPDSLPAPPPYPRPVNEADWDLSPLDGIEVIYSYEVAVDSDLHQIQGALLYSAMESVIADRDGLQGYVGSDTMVYYSPAHAAEVYANPESLKSYNKAPDYFYIADGRPGTEERKSWNVWKERGLLPDAIIEVTSKSTRRVDHTYKRDVYAKHFRTREY